VFRGSRVHLNPTARRWLVWGALLGCHVALTLYFVRPEALRAGPIMGADWDMHVQQCARALDAWRGHRKSWGYDPQMFAGSLAGTVFDLNNKMHEIVVVALTALRLRAAAAFNSFVLIAHLGVPLSAYAAARLFDFSRRAATLSAALASALWFFDSSIHWGWWIGSISWTFGAALSPLSVALFHRWGKQPRARWLAATVAALIVTLHVHPYTFFLMAPPMLASYVRMARSGISPRRHALVVGAAAITLLANLWWLSVALRFSGYLVDSAYLGGTKLTTLLWDYFGYLDDPDVTGYIAVRTSFRFLMLAAAAIAIYRWRRARDERALLLGLGVFLPFALAYLGGHFHVLRQVQPLRFVFAAAFFAAIAAAAELDALVGSFRDWVKEPRARVAFALLGVIALPKLALDVWYYFPNAMPAEEDLRAKKGDSIGGAFDNAGLFWPLHRSYAHYPQSSDERQVVEFVLKSDDGRGRWLVEWGTLAERLAWATRAQVLGGFPYFNMTHADANWFKKIGKKAEAADLPAYLERYNVGWLIRTWPVDAALDNSKLFEPVVAIGPHRIYRVRLPPSFVVGGGPARVRASFNRIEVRDAPKESFVLKYHWLDSLVCKPGCRVEREPMPADRVGFIRVFDAPSNFEIVNEY
jgi:hypothetical protein